MVVKSLISVTSKGLQSFKQTLKTFRVTRNVEGMFKKYLMFLVLFCLSLNSTKVYGTLFEASKNYCKYYFFNIFNYFKVSIF